MIRNISILCLMWVALLGHDSWAGPLVGAMDRLNEIYKDHDTSDTLKISKTFEERKEGLYKEYYEDGTIKREEHYKNGKLDGVQKDFDESGVLRQEISFVNGIEEGKQTSYDEQGKISRQWTNHNGKRDSVYYGYFSDGTIAETRNYKDGVLLDAQGGPYNGPYVVNYPGGKPYEKFFYKNGLADGLFQMYSPQGSLEMERSYVNDKLEGPTRIYENGKVVAEYQFVADVKQGLAKEYTENGHIEYTYVDDRVQGVKKFFDAQGRVRGIRIFKDGKPEGDITYLDKYGKKYPKPEILDAKSNPVPFFFLWFIAFLFSLVFHEAGHAWSALKLGDPTAYKGGQVSINPLPHIRREPVGMIILPVLSYWSQGWMMGWASAPYNPQWALTNPRRSAVMSLSGPAVNLLIVVLTGIVIRIGIWIGIFAIPDDISATVLVGGIAVGWTAVAAAFCSILFFLNVVLFAFNLLPLPPLDGSGVVPLILPHNWAKKYMGLINHPVLMIIGLITAWSVFDGIIGPIFRIFLSILTFDF